jgi:hypothetical protein
MKTSRRLFLKAAACATAPPGVPALRAADPVPITKVALDRILDAPVLQLDFLKQPVIVAWNCMTCSGTSDKRRTSPRNMRR